MRNYITLNMELLNKIMIEKKWNPSDLARHSKLSKTTISRLFNNKRGVTDASINGIMLALPDYKFEDLFFLSKVSPKGNNKRGD